MGLLGGYCETDEERAAIEQRDRAYVEAEQEASRIADLEEALLKIFNMTYDGDPVKDIAKAALTKSETR